MQIDWIETFLDLCESRNFNRTAERLGVTQSTVSGRINALEKNLGRRLFLRSRAGTTLTLEGLRFEPHARTLRVNWSEALRATRDSGPTATTLRVGIQRDLISAQIVDWIDAYRETLPETGLYIQADFSTQMCNDLMRGALDVAMVYSPTPHPDLFFQSVTEVEIRMVSDCAKRLADVPLESYVRASYAPAFERLHESLLPQFERAMLSCAQDSLLAAILTSQGGSGYLLAHHAADLVAEGRFSYVEDAPLIPQPVYSALHLRNRHRSSHRKLVQLLTKHFLGIAT